MTAKGIAQLRKKYARVAKMEPKALKEFEGQLIKYRNLQIEATGRTNKESAIQEINPTIQEAQKMLDDVQERIRNSR